MSRRLKLLKPKTAAVAYGGVYDDGYYGYRRCG